MNRIQFLIFLIFVIATALFSSWLLRSIEEKDKVITQDTILNRDYYLSDFSTVIMDETGLPYYKLSSPHLDHFPINEITKVRSPELTIYDSREYPWKLVSNNAKISNQGNLIHFSGDVKLNKSSANFNENIVIIADEITVFIEEQIAESMSKITIIQGKNSVNANGMELNLKNHTLELSSQVNGTYKIQRDE